jgi:ABC-type glycerol-3-phosphate transport system permease component
MAVILTVERKTAKARIFLALVYAVLSLGGVTMVWPFLVMLASSLTGPYDYYRFSPVVRALWDRPDRFMRYVATCYPRFPVEVYPDAPSHWGSWIIVSRDQEGCRRFAQAELKGLDDPRTAEQWRRMAADYAAFNLDYDIRNSVCAFDARDVAGFVRGHFEARVLGADPKAYAALSPGLRREAALEQLNRDWLIRYSSFFGIRMIAQQRAPLHHAGWDYPADDPKMELYQAFKRAYRELAFTPGCQAGVRGQESGVRLPEPRTPNSESMRPSEREAWTRFKAYAGRECPMTRTVPYASRPLWLNYLRRSDVQARLGFAQGRAFTPEDYGRLAGHACDSFERLPFPLPERAPLALRQEWATFVREAYPRRLLRVRVTPELERAYQAYVRKTCKTLQAYSRLTGRPVAAPYVVPASAGPAPRNASEERATSQGAALAVASFSDIGLPEYENSTLWRGFVPSVPAERLTMQSAEQAWQAHLLNAYGSVEGVNRAYGWSLARIEEARLPLREAMAVTFARRGWTDFFAGMAANYRMVGEFLFLRGQAFGNTLLLVVLSVLATLTVNPLAAYALSRFGLRAAEKILLFLLATMAFPAAVTAIPGFLLIRDLGLLNTFAALVLPTLASGMSIFILKGFFDGLPRELYEAAAIDGAKEWQILLKITLPMTTPILAVNALNAFISAYNSWEWALLVCQKQSHWTLAVWMYQMSQQLSDQPWAVMAGFVVVSVPTAVVFIACQKIILRGIVLPSMK